jgi:hypothetical protein
MENAGMKVIQNVLGRGGGKESQLYAHDNVSRRNR